MSSSDSDDEKAKAKPATRATDAEGENIELDYDKKTGMGEICVKVICLGDSAVGKSKWVAVFLQGPKLLLPMGCVKLGEKNCVNLPSVGEQTAN